MDGFAGLVLGVVGLGFLHGVLPDHGWPIAAAYALSRSSRWVSGLIAGLIIGIGHLASSLALVAVFLWVGSRVDLLGSRWLGYAAGTVLVLLGVHEYRRGDHDHREDDHGRRESDHDHQEGEQSRGEGGHDHHDHAENDRHGHARGADEDGGDREFTPTTGDEDQPKGLRGLAVAAVALGVAHEEPIQILAVCAGTAYCLELMLVYSLAVIVAILTPTMLLIAGYERHGETVERSLPYLSTVTAAVLIGLGLLFIAGIY